MNAVFVGLDPCLINRPYSRYQYNGSGVRCKFNFTVEGTLCLPVSTIFSNNAISVINKNREVVGQHIPEALAAKLHPLLSKLLKFWKVWKITAVITGQQRRASKGDMSPRGRNRASVHVLLYTYGPKLHIK